MTKYVDNKSVRSINEYIMVIVIVLLLMAIFIVNFFERDNQFSNTGLHAASMTFISQLNVIHAQWLMDKKPDVILLRELEHQDTTVSQRSVNQIPVNKKGWVDIPVQTTSNMEILTEGKSSPCQQIWQYLYGGALTVMNEPISVIDIQHDQRRSGRVCRYQVASGAYFDYSTHNGKVSAITFPEHTN